MKCQRTKVVVIAFPVGPIITLVHLLHGTILGLYIDFVSNTIKLHQQPCAEIIIWLSTSLYSTDRSRGRFPSGPNPYPPATTWFWRQQFGRGVFWCQRPVYLTRRPRLRGFVKRWLSFLHDMQYQCFNASPTVTAPYTAI